MNAVNFKGGPRAGKGLFGAGLLLVILMGMGVALLFGGCGGNNDESTSVSQIDDEAAGTSSVGGVGSAGGASGGNGGSQGDVMVDYTWDECIEDMTFRYADAEAADTVCNAIREDYSDSQQEDLANILPDVEASQNVTPNQGGTTGGGTGGGNGSGSSGGGTGGTGGTDGTGGDDNGDGGTGGGTSTRPWGEIEIDVPQGSPAP